MATHKQAPRPDTDVFVDPVSPIYERLVDQIMANIAGHFDVTDATTGSVDWQLAKLAEVGALNKKNLETILRAMPEATRMTMDALEQSVLASLEVLEPSFASAVKEGYLQNAEYPMISPRVRDVLTAYQQQARNAMNLVNTTMLDSATAAYQKVIAGTVSRVNAALSSEQTAKVLQMLNLKSGEVATGITSRRDALRQSLKELSDSGLTGFVDKAGKTWNADTYINMNLRTTSGNVAMQATFARNADYGNDLIWWPILANARPGCYPWQGKVCSTSNRSGTTTDLNDNRITIYPLNQTTFGQPDGIGGINCHHKPPNIFIPGLSAIRGEVPPKKENAAGYENTQTQRALERKVRAARRDQAMAEASNDPVAAADAEKRAKAAEGELRAFTKQSGLTFRGDRISPQGTTAPVKRTTTAKAPTEKQAQEPTRKKDRLINASGKRKIETESLNPSDIIPVNPVTDREKKDALAWDFHEKGYNGKPILVIDVGDGEYQAITGSHRIYAAREAGINIPSKVLPSSDDFSTITSAITNEDRLYEANLLFKRKKIGSDVLSLLRDEYEMDFVVSKEKVLNVSEKAKKWNLFKQESKNRDKISAGIRTDEKNATIIKKARSKEMEEYELFLAKMKSKYRDDIWSEMSDFELETFEALERKAFK